MNEKIVINPNHRQLELKIAGNLVYVLALMISVNFKKINFPKNSSLTNNLLTKFR